MQLNVSEEPIVSPPSADAPEPYDLLAALDVGVLCVAPDLRIVFGNPAWASLVGVELDEVLGRSLLDVFADGVGTSGEAMVRSVLADGVARSYRAASRRPGAEGALDVTVRRARSGVLVFTVRAVDDDAVGAAGQRSARLVASEHERLRALTRAMAAEADAELLIETVCRAAVELCGAVGGTVAQVDGETGTFICTVGHPPVLRGKRFRVEGTLTARALDEYRRTGRLTSARADAGEARDAAFFPLLEDGREVGPLLLAPLGANGELLGVLAVSRASGEPAFADPDEERLRVIADHASLALWKARLIEEAHAANATKSAFLATVSHELRTPLTALTGYGELLADEIAGPLTPSQHEIVDRVRAVTHQLTDMIEEILTFSSLEAGRELVRPRLTDSHDVMRGVANVIEPLAKQKGLGFRYSVAPELPRLVTDPDKMRQIVVNLASNAVKFSDRGEVTIRVLPDARGGVRVEVTDQGAGIAEEDRERIFHPFTQLDTGLTRRHGGTGLGLYICRRLAELLDAHIDVQSVVGVGSTFVLVLPRESGERRASSV